MTDVSALLEGTIAPLLYSAAAACVLLGVSASTRISSADRGSLLIGAGFALGLFARVMEVGSVAAETPLKLLAGGALLGVLLARSTKVGASPSSLAWISALGSAGAALSGCSIVLQQTERGAAWLVGLVVIGMGALGFVQGFVQWRSDEVSAQTSVRSALSSMYAGLSVAGLGFVFENVILLVAGGTTALASVALARVVARANERPVLDLAMGQGSAERDGYSNVQACGPEEAAQVIETAQKVLIVPGFGMAAAQAQHAVKQLADALEKRGAKVLYGVHPSAGCLPGHLNGVLDEANVPHAALAELEAANAFAATADVVLCVGANDVVNPSTDDESSELYGMPTIDVSKARAVFVVKRSLKAGASGAKNPLFEAPHTTLVFGDAKRVTQKLVTVLSGGH